MANPFITPAALNARIGRPGAPVLLDTRLDVDIAACPVRLPRGRRVTLEACEEWGANISKFEESSTIVTYCHRGGKISQIAAALLRAQGGDAVALQGGIVDWLSGNRPVVAMRDCPQRWLAPLDPTWGEVLCEWLLTRVITDSAAVLRIERDQIATGVKMFDASVLPDDPDLLLEQFDVQNWDVEPLRHGSDRLLRGRLVRGGDPLDLIDDMLAGALV